ncbi:ubiquinone anaerobic biosynthesis accessory factor UbiT [Devosia sp.]|uniref:ubiquinone anaerobic biosynthesis accessory factor UbiT n=1 Tax=Devosia sp. TaxID=1871048 RepID=UPI00375350DB
MATVEAGALMLLPSSIQTLLRPVPLALGERVAQQALASVLRRHPDLFERLGEHAGKTIVFAASDLPFEFAVNPRHGTVRAARPGGIARSDARIAGPLVLLLALAEGRLDGDAEFFGRQISIDGDMEAVLALRNAVENSAIDFTKDLAPARGPLRRPVEAVLGKVRSLLLDSKDPQWN